MCPWTRPVLLLLTLASLCLAQSGDGRPSDDEDELEVRTSYACENGLLFLECPQGHVIRVVRANYGRFTISMCNPLGITANMALQCQSVSSRPIVSGECDGHNKCEFQVTNRLFGDPCPGTSKYAEVKHYCEAVQKSVSAPNLQEVPFLPIRPSVPVPEKIKVCLLPQSSGSVYDIFWVMPKSDQTILHFMLKYMVQGDIEEKEMPSNKLEDNLYSYTFSPDKLMQGSVHQFAIKAFSLDFGWGEYSEFSVPEQCSRDINGAFITHTPSPPTTTSTTTTTAAPSEGPREGPLKLMCHALMKMGISWTETWPNEVQTRACPNYLGQGWVHYKCLSTGIWDPNGPEIDNCVPVPTTTTPTTSTTSISTTTTTTPLVTTLSPVRYAPRVYNLLRNLERKDSRKDAMQFLAKLLPGLVKNMSEEIQAMRDPRMRKAAADHFKDTMMTIGDELLKDGNAWSSLNTSMQRLAAASLLDSMEMTGLLAASTMPSGTLNTTRRSNIVMKLMNVRLDLRQDVFFESMPQEGIITKVNQFTIPASVLRQVANKYPASLSVVFVVVSNMSEWLIPDSVMASSSVDQNIIDARQQKEPVRRIVNSDIVSASLLTKSIKDLHEPVAFLMEHRQVESVENPKCSFWDTDQASWSSEGCWVQETNKTHTICQCNHLTSFAILMDITGATLMIPAQTRFSLELMTYIGCIISIICLMLSWVTFACFKSLDSDRNTIHKHLVFCLMFAQIVLVIGVQQTQPAILCSVIAGILHFFFLAAFAWMCLEGVQLYIMLIEVFESERSRVVWYYVFGYGMPTIIVAVSAAVFPGGYGTNNHCWLTTERGFIWSFVGPAMAVIVINIVMLVIAISIMVRHSGMSHTMRQKSVPQKMRSWLKGAVVLAVLLGLTWVFGILYLDNVYHTLIFSYIFTFLNSLQGLFIFCFHCLLNDKVQKEYRRLVRHSEWLPDCLRMKYGGASSTASKDPSSSGNLMPKFLRSKKKHSGCGDSSNNSARPFLHKDSRFSSSNPSSSDGATTSRLSSETTNNNRKSSRASTFRSMNDSGIQLFRSKEVDGMVGDLSEVPDCSVVDSEFVSEYCRENLRVSAELKRYSTASENSGHNGGGREGEREEGLNAEMNLDRLAALSVESLSRRLPTYQVSNSDFGDGDNRSDGWADSDNVDGEEDVAEEVERGDIESGRRTIEQFVCAEDHYTDDYDEDDEEFEDTGDVNAQNVCRHELFPPLMSVRQSDSERVLINNAVNKPRDLTQPLTASRQSPSLTDVSPTHRRRDVQQLSPSHTSVPCLNFRPGVSGTPPETAVASMPERDCVNSSLPNLNKSMSSNEDAADGADPGSVGNGQTPAPVKRTSSDGRVYFSPFKFSASEC